MSETNIAGKIPVAPNVARAAALAHINSVVGKDVRNLGAVVDLVQELLATKLDLENKLQLTNSAAPDHLSAAVHTAEQSLQQASTLQEEANQLNAQAVEQQRSVAALVDSVRPQLNTVQQHNRLRCYQALVQPVQSVSNEMDRLLRSILAQRSSNTTSSGGSQHGTGASESVLVSLYSQLEDMIGRVVGHTACHHLHYYLHDTMVHWHTQLLETFSSELKTVLSSIHYPFTDGPPTPKQLSPPTDVVNRLQTLIKHLLTLHNLPACLNKSPMRPLTPSSARNKIACHLNVSVGEASDSDPDIESLKISNKNGVMADISSKYETSSNYDNKNSKSSDEDIQEITATDDSKKSSASSNNLDTSNSNALNESTLSCESFSTATSSPRSDTISAVAPTKPQPPAIVADFAPLVTPLQILLKPMESRFNYHFCRAAKTSDLSKPEWYLTQVLSWVLAHSEFLDTVVQPVLREHQHGHLHATTEITRGLVRLVVLKLAQDLSQVHRDEDLFCHCLQETLNFERELRAVCGYPAREPAVLVVLSQPQVLTRWLQLEKKFAVAVMDELVSGGEAWTSEVEEDGKVGQSCCGERLLLLLLGITDRYTALPQPGHRLQFLAVELDVLDEFRVRAVQLARPLQRSPVTSDFSAILNCLHQVADTLADWGDMPFFLDLQVYRTRQRRFEEALESGQTMALQQPFVLQSDEVEGTVFDDCISLYRHVEQEMLDTLRQHVTSEVRARLMPYKKDKWFVEHKRPAQFDVSASLCPLLGVLARQLHALRRSVAEALFEQLWKQIASDIDKFLFEELVTQNHFSDRGLGQLEHDMTKALFAMFTEFTTHPEAYFPFVRESLTLLRLPLAPAVLLRDTLRDALETAHLSRGPALVRSETAHLSRGPALVRPETALADHSVDNIDPQMALNILAARNDVSSL